VKCRNVDAERIFRVAQLIESRLPKECRGAFAEAE
jgi:hypothetical protein